MQHYHLRNERRFSNPIISVVFHWTLFRDTDKRRLRFTSLHRIPLRRLNILQVKRSGVALLGVGLESSHSLMVNTYSKSVRPLCCICRRSLWLPLALFSSWLFTWYDSRLLVAVVVCCMQMLSVYSVRLCSHMLIFTITILLDSKAIEA